MATNDEHRERHGWSDVAKAYSAKINNITTVPAKRAVSIASSIRPIDKDSLVLDVGSGAGAVTRCVAETAPARITAIDSAQGMLDAIEVPPGTQLEKRLLDANKLSEAFPEATFSHVFCTFVLHVVPDELHVVQEMRKVLSPGGIIAIAVWGKRMDNTEIWKRAFQTIEPTYELPRPLRTTWSWRTADTLRENLEAAGFRDIQTTEEMTMPFGFDSAEEWTKFAFESKHPIEQTAIGSWKGDLGEARQAFFNVSKEHFNDTKDMKASAVIAVARL